jgi:D-3-phosphoglycerate dehydrogenase
MKKILVTDPIHPEAIAYLKEQGFFVDIKTDLDSNALKQALPGYQALICRTSTKVTGDVLLAGDSLQCIGVHATGWDHIDTITARDRGILLLGYPPRQDTFDTDKHNGSFIPVAEYVLMNMLVTSKKLIEANHSMKSQKWEKYSLSGSELYGKTLGIIGLGRIGSLVAERARAFGMEVIAYNPRLEESEAARRGAKLVSLETIYDQSDFITVHIPKTPENINFINMEAFHKMQKKPVLINTSRASIINENALMKALEDNLLKNVVLDVFEGAPHHINWELVRHPKVIATPHIAGVSDESLRRVSLHTAKIVTDYLKYGKINGLIDDKSSI